MRALIYKEWLKLRGAWLVILGGNLAFCAYLYLDIRHQFRVEHAEMLFYQASRIGRLFYEDLRYVPLLTGCLTAVAQYAPEILKSRLRLAMHLPIGLTALILIHLAIGLTALGLILAIDAAALALTVGQFFPAAFATSALATAAPWLLAGVAGYLGLTLTLLEPRRRYQVTNLALALGGTAWLCHLSDDYGAYDRALWGVALLILLMVPAALVPAHRFRFGGR